MRIPLPVKMAVQRRCTRKEVLGILQLAVKVALHAWSCDRKAVRKAVLENLWVAVANWERTAMRESVMPPPHSLTLSLRGAVMKVNLRQRAGAASRLRHRTCLHQTTNRVRHDLRVRRGSGRGVEPGAPPPPQRAAGEAIAEMDAGGLGTE